MDLIWAHGRMLKQAFSKVGEVSTRISGWSHALVDLKYMHAGPRDIVFSQRTQHDPGSVSAADSEGKASTRRDRSTSICGNHRRSCPRDGIGILKHFEVHGIFSNPIY
jgi:hypothetical protein